MRFQRYSYTITSSCIYHPRHDTRTTVKFNGAQSTQIKLTHILPTPRVLPVGCPHRTLTGTCRTQQPRKHTNTQTDTSCVTYVCSSEVPVSSDTPRHLQMVSIQSWCEVSLLFVARQEQLLKLLLLKCVLAQFPERCNMVPCFHPSRTRKHAVSYWPMWEFKPEKFGCFLDFLLVSSIFLTNPSEMWPARVVYCVCHATRIRIN